MPSSTWRERSPIPLSSPRRLHACSARSARSSAGISASSGRLTPPPRAWRASASGGPRPRICGTSTARRSKSTCSATWDLRDESALAAGLHAVLAFPVKSVDGDARGVIELFSRATRESHEELLDLARAVGSDVGEFIERREAEEALGETRARQRAEQRELKRTLG